MSPLTQQYPTQQYYPPLPPRPPPHLPPVPGNNILVSTVKNYLYLKGMYAKLGPNAIMRHPIHGKARETPRNEGTATCKIRPLKA
eukprot:1189645-Prorocentrum_minimum.AAC.2